MFQIDRQALIETTAGLVRIPSINPSLVPGAGGERAVAEAIAARLQRTPGITVDLQDAGDGRPNVIASVGNGPGRTLMLNGHTDTVGVAGMEDPFSGRIDGNRLYGRGSSDMKAAMAAARTYRSAGGTSPLKPAKSHVHMPTPLTPAERPAFTEAR